MLRFKSFNDWWFSGACRKFDGILLDIDGTLLSGRKKALPGALELVSSLRKTGFRFGIHVTGQKERLGRGGSESLHQL